MFPIASFPRPVLIRGAWRLASQPSTQGRWREKFGKPVNETFGFLVDWGQRGEGGCGCEGISETSAVCGGYKGAWWGWGTESAYGTPTMPVFIRQLDERSWTTLAKPAKKKNGALLHDAEINVHIFSVTKWVPNEKLWFESLISQLQQHVPPCLSVLIEPLGGI